VPGSPYSASHRPGRVVFPLISPFSSAMTLIERYRPVTTQRFALSSNSWPCGHLTPRPAVRQRLVLSSGPTRAGAISDRDPISIRFPSSVSPLRPSRSRRPCGVISAELRVRIHSPPAASLQTFGSATSRRSLVVVAESGEGMVGSDSLRQHASDPEGAPAREHAW
jgi:hypothetical protein